MRVVWLLCGFIALSPTTVAGESCGTPAHLCWEHGIQPTLGFCSSTLAATTPCPTANLSITVDYLTCISTAIADTECRLLTIFSLLEPPSNATGNSTGMMAMSLVQEDSEHTDFSRQPGDAGVSSDSAQLSTQTLTQLQNPAELDMCHDPVACIHALRAVLPLCSIRDHPRTIGWMACVDSRLAAHTECTLAPLFGANVATGTQDFSRCVSPEAQQAIESAKERVTAAMSALNETFGTLDTANSTDNASIAYEQSIANATRKFENFRQALNAALPNITLNSTAAETLSSVFGPEWQSQFPSAPSPHTLNWTIPTVNLTALFDQIPTLNYTTSDLIEALMHSDERFADLEDRMADSLMGSWENSTKATLNTSLEIENAENILSGRTVWGNSTQEDWQEAELNGVVMANPPEDIIQSSRNYVTNTVSTAQKAVAEMTVDAIRRVRGFRPDLSQFSAARIESLGLDRAREHASEFITHMMGGAAPESESERKP